ncbi:2OG-Fe dioxygenase family protein [Rhodanobacter sp. B2A1Ga4]|uniref:2OG-Fe dioxygenase family protein n=1 Tax=Rhodanobacter sp. B2A1Ga4 TaxID=2778647 RepID=UPI001B376473|nr:2OG-Fe dioxygenase family protein [Rhodanobacter sp. B2A1Ga4]MBQ4854665.1 2OG-Fe dioxygenase family protein [Rhodanobacter sp. B2A1Ga4]
MTPLPDTSALHDRLQRDGFAFVTADIMRTLLEASTLDDWPAFVASWNDLAPDTYLAASGRHRRRRHATFAADADGGIRREAHQPHYQSLKYNPLQGDIQRWFEPVLPAIADGASLRRILGFCRDCFGALAPAVSRWHVEVHQFRIEARADEAGEPTPEGVHRDGVDYVLVLLIDRENIESGTTTIHARDGAVLGSFTLTHALDAALVDDARVLHGVTAVTPLDPARPAHRDVLVVTFKAVTSAT